MTLVIRAGETQRSFTERVLREQGRISAHEAMFDLVDEDGRRHSITRLAPVIDDLRNRRGWDIETRSGPGQQAVYHLRGVAHGHAAAAVRTCPACRRQHAVGTTCAASVPTGPGWDENQVAGVFGK